MAPSQLLDKFKKVRKKNNNNNNDNESSTTTTTTSSSLPTPPSASPSASASASSNALSTMSSPASPRRTFARTINRYAARTFHLSLPKRLNINISNNNNNKKKNENDNNENISPTSIHDVDVAHNVDNNTNNTITTTNNNNIDNQQQFNDDDQSTSTTNSAVPAINPAYQQFADPPGPESSFRLSLNSSPPDFPATDVGAWSSAGWHLVADTVHGSGHAVRARKPNQDSFGVLSSGTALYVGVFDGHGVHGRDASQLARDSVPKSFTHALSTFSSNKALSSDNVIGTSTDFETSVLEQQQQQQQQQPVITLKHTENQRKTIHRAFTRAFTNAERTLREDCHGVDHAFSGTTATTLWLQGRELFCAWVGDSRAVLARCRRPSSLNSSHDAVLQHPSSSTSLRSDLNNNTNHNSNNNNNNNSNNNNNGVIAIDLTSDHKPTRRDEKKRVRSAGGRVTRWHASSSTGPQRVWLPNEWLPGLAMTRSIGDTVLSKHGVVASPEVTVTQICDGDTLIVASDGVWEFMSSSDVVALVARLRRAGFTATDCAIKLVDEAVHRWRNYEQVVDDTTAIVIFIDKVGQQQNSKDNDIDNDNEMDSKLDQVQHLQQEHTEKEKDIRSKSLSLKRFRKNSKSILNNNLRGRRSGGNTTTLQALSRPCLVAANGRLEHFEPTEQVVADDDVTEEDDENVGNDDDNDDDDEQHRNDTLRQIENENLSGDMDDDGGGGEGE